MTDRPRLPRSRAASALLAAALLALAASTLAPPARAAPARRPSRAVCPGPVSLGTAACHSRVITDSRGTPLASGSPSGYGPAAFHTAYELPYEAPGTPTVAIVDAYDAPNIESDLGVYSSTYDLPPCTTANGCFRKVNQSGEEGSYPRADGGWALEIALDVETVHAICSDCHILLVEASSNAMGDLSAGVQRAASLGAMEISNSYGGAEYSGEAADSTYDHPGIAITASAGDSGYGAEYPAASPYVVAVGGTTLELGPANAYEGESVWSGSGSGCSAYISVPAWQTADLAWPATGCAAKRGVADVATDANPDTGASVYDTTKYQGQSGWFTVGGTSLSAPLIAAVYALANPASAQYPAATPYQHQADSPHTLHDVTSGSNGSCSGTTMCTAAAGYDGPTGVGTPKGVAAFGTSGSADRTPPQTTIDAGPAGPTNDSTPTFQFSSSESGSTFECRIDAAAFAACSSPFTSSTLSDGPHSIDVRATDAAGNTDQSPASRSFSIDTVAPTSHAASAASSASATVTVSYTASDGGGGIASLELWAKPPGAATYEMAADRGSSDSSGTFSYTATAGDGSYAFYTRATDAAGNYEAAPASADSTTLLDTTAPQTTIDAGPSGPTKDPTPSFGFSSNEGGSSFQCRLDGGVFGACSSPFTSPSLSDGPHSFEVRATDAAGNTDQSAASRSFSVDTVAPASMASAPATTKSTAIEVTYVASDAGSGLASIELWVKPPGAATFAKEMTMGAPSASGSFTYTAATAAGSYSFFTRATDGAGNQEAAPAEADATTLFDLAAPAPPTEPTAGEEQPQLTAPVSEFRFGRTARRRRSVSLVVRLPGPGSVVLRGPKVHALSKQAPAAGPQTLTVRLRRKFRQASRAEVSVTFTPLGGLPKTKTRMLRFR